jgi:hypothetical protein
MFSFSSFHLSKPPDDKVWQKFRDALDEPSKVKPKLQKLIKAQEFAFPQLNYELNYYNSPSSSGNSFLISLAP